jgi:hypothetical protein
MEKGHEFLAGIPHETSIELDELIITIWKPKYEPLDFISNAVKELFNKYGEDEMEVKTDLDKNTPEVLSYGASEFQLQQCKSFVLLIISKEVQAPALLRKIKKVIIGKVLTLIDILSIRAVNLKVQGEQDAWIRNQLFEYENPKLAFHSTVDNWVLLVSQFIQQETNVLWNNGLLLKGVSKMKSEQIITVKEVLMGGDVEMQIAWLSSLDQLENTQKIWLKADNEGNKGSNEMVGIEFQTEMRAMIGTRFGNDKVITMPWKLGRDAIEIWMGKVLIIINKSQPHWKKLAK